jgi:hypothetical protein
VVEIAKCFVCGADAEEVSKRDYGQIARLNCPRCGKFEASRSVFADERSDKDIAVLSLAVRHMQRKQKWPFLDSALKEQILASRSVPTPPEQADLFLLWLCEELGAHYAGSRTVKFLTAAGVMGALSPGDAIFVLGHMHGQNLIQMASPSLRGDSDDFRVPMPGWTRYFELIRREAESWIAFMAMPFGNPQLDELFLKHWKAAVLQTGFELRRVDESPRAGLIDDRLRVEIRRARFLICELTGENRGAYWEAGFAEGLQKPVIYLCEKSQFERQKTHFDTNHHLTVVWEKSEIRNAEEQLKATIRATLPAEAKLSDQ